MNQFLPRYVKGVDLQLRAVDLGGQSCFFLGGVSYIHQEEEDFVCCFIIWPYL